MSGVFDLRPLVTTYVNEPLSMTYHDAEINSPLLLVNKIASNLTVAVGLIIKALIGQIDTSAVLLLVCYAIYI